MGDLRIRLYNTVTDEEKTVQLPDTMPVERIIRALVKQFQLPEHDYQLRLADESTPLAHDVTLGGLGVTAGTGFVLEMLEPAAPPSAAPPPAVEVPSEEARPPAIKSRFLRALAGAGIWLACFALTMVLSNFVYIARCRSLGRGGDPGYYRLHQLFGMDGWGVWAILGAIVLMFVYLVFSQDGGFRLGKRDVTRILLGVVVFAFARMIAQNASILSSPWTGEFYSPESELLASMLTGIVFLVPVSSGFFFGPVVGLYVGGLGSLLGDSLSCYNAPWWHVGFGVTGVTAGLARMYFQRHRESGPRILQWVTLALVAGVVVIAWVWRDGPILRHAVVPAVLIAALLMVFLPRAWSIGYAVLALALTAVGIWRLLVGELTNAGLPIWLVALALIVAGIHLRSKTGSFTNWLDPQSAKVIAVWSALAVLVGSVLPVAFYFVRTRNGMDIYEFTLRAATNPAVLFALLVMPMIYVLWEVSRQEA
jgi:hypothetical protein